MKGIFFHLCIRNKTKRILTSPNWVSHCTHMLVIPSCWYLQFKQIKALMSLSLALCDWISLWHCKQPNTSLQHEVWKSNRYIFTISSIKRVEWTYFNLTFSMIMCAQCWRHLDLHVKLKAEFKQHNILENKVSNFNVKSLSVFQPKPESVNQLTEWLSQQILCLKFPAISVARKLKGACSIYDCSLLNSGPELDSAKSQLFCTVLTSFCFDGISK